MKNKKKAGSKPAEFQFSERIGGDRCIISFHAAARHFISSMPEINFVNIWKQPGSRLPRLDAIARARRPASRASDVPTRCGQRRVLGDR